MKVARAGLALILGGLAGWGADRIGIPLPWMLGPMIACTIAAVAGAPLLAPLPLRPIFYPAIGVMLGSGFTAEVLAHALDWWATLLLLVPYLVAMAGVSYAIFRRVAGYDPVTAFFCAMPGGLNDMLLMGEANGGDVRQIGLAHAVRILVVISLVVLFYGLVLGVSSGDRDAQWTPMQALSLSDWVLLGLAGAAGSVMGHVLRLPAGAVFGPMILSAVVHVAGWVHTAPPTVIVNSAQVVIGTIVGCRFIGTRAGEVLVALGYGIVSALAMILTAAGAAALVHAVTGIDLSQAFLAYAPGGLAEMSLLSLAMGQDVAYVTTIHVVRLVLVIGCAGWALRVVLPRGR